MSKSKVELNWVEVDVASFKGDKTLEAGYVSVKAAQAAATKARGDFEASFIAKAKKAGTYKPEEGKLVFGYRFGKLSVALAPESEKKDNGKPKFSF